MSERNIHTHRKYIEIVNFSRSVCLSHSVARIQRVRFVGRISERKQTFCRNRFSQLRCSSEQPVELNFGIASSKTTVAVSPHNVYGRSQQLCLPFISFAAFLLLHQFSHFVFVFYVPKRMLIHCIAYLRRAPIAGAFGYLCERCLSVGPYHRCALTHTHPLRAPNDMTVEKATQNYYFIFIPFSERLKNVRRKVQLRQPEAHIRNCFGTRDSIHCVDGVCSLVWRMRRKNFARAHRGYYLFMLCGNLASAIR